MDVSQYAVSQERDPWITLKDTQVATAKVLAVRPGKDGLFLTVKMDGKRFAHQLRFSQKDGSTGIDLSTTIDLLGSDTDDWIGESLKFVGRKGTAKNKAGKIPVYANVFRPKAKKATKKGKR